MSFRLSTGEPRSESSMTAAWPGLSFSTSRPKNGTPRPANLQARLALGRSRDHDVDAPGDGLLVGGVRERDLDAQFRRQRRTRSGAEQAACDEYANDDSPCDSARLSHAHTVGQAHRLLLEWDIIAAIPGEALRLAAGGRRLVARIAAAHIQASLPALLSR